METATRTNGRRRSREQAPAPFDSPSFGQAVWIRGRKAIFLYARNDRGAAIRYCHERAARIVPWRSIALDPPHAR
jgi:hypothetical protein